MTSEKTEGEDVKDIKSQMNGYSKDIHLKSLKNVDAEKFFGASFKSLSYVQRAEVLEKCNGHPFLLKLVGEAADMDYSVTAENTGLTIDDVKHVKCVVKERLQKAFEKLSKKEQLTLLAVPIFGRDAQLNVLHHVLGVSQPRSEFIEEVKKQFFDQFWLAFNTFVLKEEKEKYTVVNAHHPLVLEFLKMKISNIFDNKTSPYYADCIKMKRRYVMYYVNEMVSIGEGCVQGKHRTEYFLPSLISRFVRIKPHLKTTFEYISHTDDPVDCQLLFSADVQSPALRKSTEILNIFLCLYQFHDYFDECLLQAVKYLLHGPLSDPKHRVLVWTLYVMLLTVEGSWGTLYGVIKDQVEMIDPKALSVFYDLYSFCKAIYRYANGTLHTLSSWAKDCSREDLIKKRNTDLAEALNLLNLKQLSSDSLGVRIYFSVHVLVMHADSVYYSNQDKLSNIQQSYALSKEAKKRIAAAESSHVNVDILRPLVLSKLATFRACEGNLNLAERKEKYQEAGYLHATVTTELEQRGMKHSVMAARNLIEHATLMRSLGITHADDGSKREALKCLRTSIYYSQQAVSILELSFRKSKFDLFIAYVDTADSWEISQALTDKSACYQRVKCQNTAFKYQRKAYNLILKYYHSCHISANESRLEKLKWRFKVMLTKHCFPQMHIDKVCSNLQRVQDLARKDTDEKVHLSGSEFDTGSESSSDNEEFVIEPSGDLPKQSTSDIVAPFTNFGITQSTHTKPVDATQIDIEMSSPDHDSPTRKRKRAA